MRYRNTAFGYILMGSLLLLSSGTAATAQGKDRMTIRATAMGTITQPGRVYDVFFCVSLGIV